MTKEKQILSATDREKPKKKHCFLKALKITCLTGLVLTIFGMIFMVSYVYGIEEWKEFDPKDVEEMELGLTIYDKNGQEYQRLFNKEDRRYVEIEQIPEHVKNAFIAIEDARFYEHGGVDFIRIGGALIEDIKSGGIVQGASTISQQLIKTSLLTSDQNISRKLAEVMMAFKLEQAYSKNEILEMYLNLVYFGNGAYGIESAAEIYFHRPVEELTIAQAAVLAGTLKSPSNYAPHINYKNSMQRKELVLDAMLEYGFISEQEYEDARREQITVYKKEESVYNHGFYTDMILSQAEEILEMESDELLKSGYKIETTLDPELQTTLEELCADEKNFPENAANGDQVQCAVVVLSAKTGEIVSVSGGREHTTRRAFNRAMALKRQPGSTIKPVLIYAPALEYKQYTTTTFLLDEREDFNGYNPRNAGSTYRGWVTMRDAVALSLNIPAVRTLQDIGVETGMDYASSVGIPFSEEDKNLSIALGGFTNGISPLQLAGAYLPFANEGYYTPPYAITRITDRDGNIVYENHQAKYQVLSEESAFLVSSMLSSCVEYGTAKKVALENVPLCAKTGTSTYDDAQNNKDAWIVAYNTDYIVCCWMGFDKTDEEHSLQKGVTGGTYPAELVKKVYSYLYEGKTGPQIEVPDEIVEVNLDKEALQEQHVVLRAGIWAPEEDTIAEYYTYSTMPRAQADTWKAPEPPEDLTIIPDGKGRPMISFTPDQDGVTYILKRKELPDGTETTIATINEQEEKFYYTDEDVEAGKTYAYYVLPSRIGTEGTAIDGTASAWVEFSPNYSEDNTPARP